MSIDWSKAEEKLDKKQAVEGRNLLELRSKGDYLREKLEEANENLLQRKEKFYLLSKDHEKSEAANRRKLKEKEVTINNLEIEIDEVKIVLFDAIKHTDNTNLHTGLNMIATLKANSVEEAKESSKNFVETALNLISFSTLTYCNPAKLVSAINIVDKYKGCLLNLTALQNKYEHHEYDNYD